MLNERFVKFAFVKNLFQAELIQGVVEAAGIPCEIRDKGQVEIYDGMGAVWTEGIVLRVPESLLQQAKDALEAARAAGEALEADLDPPSTQE